MGAQNISHCNQIAMQTYGENVILILEEGKTVGFIDHNAKIFSCAPMKSDDIAKLIDPEYGVVARTMRKNGDTTPKP